MMKTEFDIRIETIIDGILNKANKHNVEIIVEHVYEDEDNPIYGCAAFIQNVLSERFGILTLNLEDHDPDKVQFLTFCPKMYQYGKAEGFTKDESFKVFGNKILKNVELSEFVKFILSEETY